MLQNFKRFKTYILTKILILRESQGIPIMLKCFYKKKSKFHNETEKTNNLLFTTYNAML